MNAMNVLFIAPSLALIKQTLESWSEQSREEFSHLCVCSDNTVANKVDDGDISILDFSVPVTTDSEIRSKFLSVDLEKTEKLFFLHITL